MSDDDAARSEAEGVTMATVSWRGITFEVPRYRLDWPFDAVVAAEQGKFPTMLSILMPDHALAEFRALRPTGRDANSLLAAVGTALGFDDDDDDGDDAGGNSKASTD